MDGAVYEYGNLYRFGPIGGHQPFSGGETAAIMYALTLLVMNCRYILFSITIAQKFDKSMGTLQRLGFGLLNTDEILVLPCSKKESLVLLIYLVWQQFRILDL